jgi:CRP-like cAMP-binding protein
MLRERPRAYRAAGPGLARLQNALRQLPEGGVERQAVDAGEVDAVVDYANSNIIMFPFARRALGGAAKRATAAAANRQPTLQAIVVANGVLAALPRADYERLLPGLEPVALKLGEVVHEEGAPMRYVYFLVDCVVSLLTRTEGRRTAAIGMVGHEGMVGMSLVYGVDASSVRAQVLAAGTAMRMAAERFRDEFRRCLPLQRELYRYAYVEVAQARQTAACTSSHHLEQRLASMLLMISDRSRSQDIFLTQEYLAAILHTRRESITEAAGTLRSRKLISYSRGKIVIVRRKGLEAASCSCYRKMETLQAACMSGRAALPPAVE